MQFADRGNQKEDADLLVGSEAHAMIQDAEKHKLGASRIQEFYESVRKYFETVCTYLVKKLPLTEPFLYHVQVLDPAKQLQSEASSLRYLLDRFPALITEDCSKDSVLEEFARYQQEDIKPFLMKTADGAKEKKEPERVDKVWEKITSTFELPALSRVVTGLMTVPHSSAACERVFSVVRKNSTEQRSSLSEEVLEAMMVVKAKPNQGAKFSKAELRQLKGAYYQSLKKST